MPCCIVTERKSVLDMRLLQTSEKEEKKMQKKGCTIALKIRKEQVCFSICFVHS